MKHNPVILKMNLLSQHLQVRKYLVSGYFWKEMLIKHAHAMIGLPGSAMEVEEDILLDDEPEAMEPDHSAEHTDAIHPDMVSVYFELLYYIN